MTETTTILAVALFALAALVFGLVAWPNQTNARIGRLLSVVARVARPLDSAAVALRVAGEINMARDMLLRDAPEVVQGRLRIKWARPTEAAAAVESGDVVVVMRRSSHHDENLIQALMAYLPQSVLPIGRPYLNFQTVRALDFTLARRILMSAGAHKAVSHLNEQHVEPARQADSRLAQQLVTIDAIDLYGWLTRVLLVEYRRLGDVMYPGAQDARYAREADELATWLYKLAQPGTEGSLQFRGQFFRVAVVFVAMAGKLRERGLEPYRSRVLNLLYRDKFHVVHLMARDQNMQPVRDLLSLLQEQDLVGETATYEYDLREDFATKRMNRQRAIAVAVRPRIGVDSRVSEAVDSLPSNTLTLPELPAEPLPALFPIHVEEGRVTEIEKTRGFGFIEETTGQRIFFHASELIDCNLADLSRGARVIYRRAFEARRNKHHAEAIKLLPQTPRARLGGTASRNN